MLNRLFSLNIKLQFVVFTAFAITMLFAYQLYYYNKTSQVALEKIAHLTNDTISRVGDSSNLILQRIKDTTLFFAYSGTVQEMLSTIDDFEKYTLFTYSRDIMKAVVQTDDAIDNVVITTNYPPQCMSYTDMINNENIETIYNAARRLKDKTGFFYLDDLGIMAYTTPVRSIRIGSRYGEEIGAVILIINYNVLKKMVIADTNPNDTELYLVDQDNRILISNAEINNSFLDLNNFVHRKSDIVIEMDLDLAGWNIIGIVRGEEVIKDYNLFRSFTVIAGVIFSLLIVALSLALNKGIGKPVSRLLQEIKQLGNNNYYYKQIDVKLGNEIGLIAENINIMLQNLHTMSKKVFENQQKLYEAELSKREAEIHTLQSQINPHFLFNTMQCVAALAMMKDSPEIAEISMAMVEIFKYATKSEDMVYIKDELYITSQYVRIIEIRLNGRFKYITSVDDDILEMKISKMLLQPIIENAVFHGIEKIYDEGVVTLSGHRLDGYTIFEITDNGPGFSPQTLESLNTLLLSNDDNLYHFPNKRGIGIVNTQKRIKMIYGNDCGIKIENKEGYTSVIIKIKS